MIPDSPSFPAIAADALAIAGSLSTAAAAPGSPLQPAPVPPESWTVDHARWPDGPVHGPAEARADWPLWRRDNRFYGATRGHLELCLHWRDQSEKYGDRFFVEAVEAGRTCRMRLQVELGTPERDGAARIWIDGALRLERTFRFLGSGQDWKLTQYKHNVFNGGDNPARAPLRDQHVLLGPVHVGTGAARPGPQAATSASPRSVRPSEISL